MYRYACTRLVREALRRFGALSLILDKRYTNPDLRRRLNQTLAEGIEDLGTALVLEHTDSEAEYALQVADAVAWSLLQKYEHHDQRLWKIIEGRTIEVRL